MLAVVTTLMVGLVGASAYKGAEAALITTDTIRGVFTANPLKPGQGAKVIVEEDVDPWRDTPSRLPAAGNGMNLLTPLDKNKDSKVSLDEYRSPILVRFDAMDSNKDGQVTTAERDAHVRNAVARRN